MIETISDLMAASTWVDPLLWGLAIGLSIRLGQWIIHHRGRGL